ncbi:hypothetical protein BSKO_04299 [Bryopsis sp. KO-2023]|nr:hypothetical protein BSKO_04299 [Bryopsis sp. KO-2023]
MHISKWVSLFLIGFFPSAIWRSEDNYEQISADLVPSVGVEIHSIKHGKKGKKSLVAREVGGLMMPMWPRFFGECDTFVFVVDMSQRAMISEATMELYELLTHDETQGKNIGLVLNKGDLPCTLSRKEIDWVMQLPKLQMEVERLQVFELSALTGQGTDLLLGWIIEKTQGSASIG